MRITPRKLMRIEHDLKKSKEVLVVMEFRYSTLVHEILSSSPDRMRILQRKLSRLVREMRELRKAISKLESSTR